MSYFARQVGLEPVAGIRPLPKPLMITTLSLAAASFALSGLTPVWLEPVVGLVAGPADCTNLIPKLQEAPGRFDQASICAADTRLWVAFYGVLSIHLAAAAGLLALNAKHLSTAVLRGLTVKQRMGAASFFALGAGLFPFYLYLDLGGLRRWTSGLENYRDVLVYAADQILRLGVGSAFFLSLNLIIMAGVFIRRPD